MKLNEQQQAQLIKHLKDSWKTPAACPVCHRNDWDVPNIVYELREFHGGGMIVGGSSLVPVMPITCKGCGNTVLINPLIAGVRLEDRQS